MSDKAQDKQVPNPGVGADIGTANIVISREMPDGSFQIRHHRNMLYRLEISEEADDLLKRSGYLYVKTDRHFYIVGNDALTVANAIGRGEIIRPMQNGMLNPTLQGAKNLLFHIIKLVVGDPIVKDEALRFSLPANPVDTSENVNNQFHERVLRSFFASMGYSPQPINEAMANIFKQRPVMEVEGEGKKELSGYSISFGGGMANSCVALEGYPVAQFSNVKCGDWIDAQAAQVTGEPLGIVMKVKETKLDLAKPESEYESEMEFALSTYYDEMISRVLRNVSKELQKEKRHFPGALDMVVCGGSALIPGFVDRLKRIAEKADLPFKVREIRLAKDPFFSVSEGSCLAARSDMAKRKKEEGK